MNFNLTRRQLIIIAAVVLLLIIIVVVLLSINNDSETTEQAFKPQIYDADNVNSQANVREKALVDDEAAIVMSVARNFTARYLSFSNENWGDNISALEGQMTEGMIQRAQLYLASLKREYPLGEFYGVSAKVLSQNIVAEVGGGYTLQLSVQLQETIGSAEEISYAEYEIDLAASGDDWLVNNFYLNE